MRNVVFYHFSSAILLILLYLAFNEIEVYMVLLNILAVISLCSLRYLLKQNERKAQSNKNRWHSLVPIIIAYTIVSFLFAIVCTHEFFVFFYIFCFMLIICYINIWIRKLRTVNGWTQKIQR